MNFLRVALSTFLAMVLSAMNLAALAQAPVVDKEYKLISPAQTPTTANKKIEVIEFFSYLCPHCAEFENPLRSWLKRIPQDVEFKSVPVVFRDSWAPGAKLFFALEAMGVLEKLHGQVFRAIHVENKDLNDADKSMKWAATQGVDGAKFTQTYNSFGVEAKVERAKKMGRDYGVMFTPAVAINGKYLTGPSMAMGPDNHPSYERFFQVVDQLIDQERPKAAAAPKKK